MDLGPTELLIVLLIVLLIFGGSQLPKLARSMGQAAKEFRDGVSAVSSSSEGTGSAE
jgi:sec-independent protein translocase protein TatA